MRLNGNNGKASTYKTPPPVQTTGATSNSVSEARRGLERYLTFYNYHRPHSTLDGSTPYEVYFGCREEMPDAA
jgi:transposase InsO family protein